MCNSASWPGVRKILILGFGVPATPGSHLARCEGGVDRKSGRARSGELEMRTKNPKVCGSQPPPPISFPQLPASMFRAPAVAASLAFLESSMLPMLVQRRPIMPRKRARKPRRMAVIMSARQPWTYPGEREEGAAVSLAPLSPSPRPYS